MKSIVLLSFLLTGVWTHSVLGQQCDVVVTSQAALNEQLMALLSNVELHIDTNTSSTNMCEDIMDRIESLKIELEERLDNVAANMHVIMNSVGSLQTQLNRLHLAGRTRIHSAASCSEVLSLIADSPSGYYWIKNSLGQPAQQYCDMTRSCGGVTGGWMRVANLDMRNNSHQCPRGLRQRTDSDKRTCVRNSDSAGCSSVTIPTFGVEYSRVCGRIIGYQWSSPDAFGHYSLGGSVTIDSPYVDGVSLTRGRPRQHIWSFAAALDEAAVEGDRLYNCPCINTNFASDAALPPAFVGADYFCDTGNERLPQRNIFHGDDPLWDGAGCGPQNTCCSFNNPPWFSKQLPQPTTDDIEMRVCRDQHVTDEDIALERVGIYVS